MQDLKLSLLEFQKAMKLQFMMKLIMEESKS